MKTNKILDAFKALSSEEKSNLLKELQSVSPIVLDREKCLPLIYRTKDGKDEELWEIIPSRIKEIEGIKSAGLCFALKHEDKKLNHGDAIKSLKKGWDLHDPANHWDMFEEKDKRNATVAILREYGIEADELREDDWYWTKRSIVSNPDNAYLSNMRDGALFCNDKLNCCYVLPCRALNF